MNPPLSLSASLAKSFLTLPVPQTDAISPCPRVFVEWPLVRHRSVLQLLATRLAFAALRATARVHRRRVRTFQDHTRRDHSAQPVSMNRAFATIPRRAFVRRRKDTRARFPAPVQI